MAVARFYHLTRDPPETLLPVLIGKALEIGLRVVLRGADAERLAALDRHLWMVDGFLPHAIKGGAQDADQPVLLVADATPLADLPGPAAGCLITLDGAPVSAPEAKAVERMCVVFDGTDEVAVATARQQWRDLTGAGLPAEYWSRDSGRWDCKARHPKVK